MGSSSNLPVDEKLLVSANGKQDLGMELRVKIVGQGIPIVEAHIGYGPVHLGSLPDHQDLNLAAVVAARQVFVGQSYVLAAVRKKIVDVWRYKVPKGTKG